MIIYIFFLGLLFVLGACIGSFIDVVCMRAETDEEFITTRSHCDSCKHKLAAIDLIPLISFLQLGGKCRYCKAQISRENFIAELLLGILFAFAGISTFPFFRETQQLFLLVLLLRLSVVGFFFYMALYDLKYSTIEAVPVYIFIALITLLLIFIYIANFFHFSPFFYQNYTSFLINHFVTAIVTFIFFLGIYKITKEKGIGGGDVQISFLIGLILGGKSTILALYIAFLVGAFFAVSLLIFKKSKMKDAIPFGPFLAIGVIVSILYASQILSLKLFDFLNIASLLLKS